MKFNKILLVSALMAGALTACGDSESAVSEHTKIDALKELVETVAAEAAAEDKKYDKMHQAIAENAERDLGGMEIVMAGWGNVTEPEVKTSTQQEMLWEYRNEMMEKHNFSYEEKKMATWDGLLELMSTSTMAGDPAAQIFRIHVNFLEAAKNSGLLYDLASLDSIDVRADKWGKPLIDRMSDGDAVYGVSIVENPLICVYFNKRLFEEAGIDPELLYDLQAAGEWTWEKFEEISELVTRDLDNDGLIDIHAINCNPYFFTQAAVFSNGSSYVMMDEDGQYHNNLNDPKTRAAFEWARDYWQTDNEIMPENWDGHINLFLDGKVAMYLAGSWNAVALKPSAMADDWGMVAFPMGPSATEYPALYSYDAYVIPATYTKEEAENIAYAYDIFTNPAPGYDQPDDWKINLYSRFRDTRAVDETLTMLRNSKNPQLDHSSVLAGAGLQAGEIGSEIYTEEASIEQAIESRMSQWNIELDKINSAHEKTQVASQN
ncbi:ABC transporter substrate-binding protein [Candidatus Epulonipiscium viviparus]|uniref:ABC transporter substrate-binding protein n=1 Tax=Candidatus Epulonipiscium viviparus TaxID=420336 RepID=UPI0027380A59|nr:extracellular solute-binding protein [Candidatus Epulopiscium viviparus]